MANDLNSLLQRIKSDGFKWKGESNGDKLINFEGRKLEKLALILSVMAEEMKSEKRILNEADRYDLFYREIRGISHFDFESSINLWKLIE